MRKAFAALLGLLPFLAGAHTLDAGAFQLKLPAGFTSQPSSDPQQFVLYSKAEDTYLTLSYLPMNAPAARLPEVARKLLEFRLQGEQAAAAASGLHLTIAEPIVVPFSRGQQVAYFGKDNHGRVFRYLGIVVPQKTINVFAESPSRSTQDLEKLFNQVLQGLKF
jgi:hypothetical protein